MKNIAFTFLCVFFGLSAAYATPLQGTYTIDSSAANSSSNFKSWSLFATSLSTNGVSGAVIVNVLTGSNESSQVVFGPITGSSNTNTVNILGNGFKVRNSLSDAVVLFAGADFVSIDSAVIENYSSNSAAMGIRFTNASDYNRIVKCAIVLSGLTTVSSSSGAYIAFSNSSSNPISSSVGNLGSFNTIALNMLYTSNSMSPGPAYGITVNGSSASFASTPQNNNIVGNRILNFAYTGIYMGNVNGNHVVKNEITRVGADSNNCYSTLYGIFVNKAYASNRSFRIDSNVIHELSNDSALNLTAANLIYGIYSSYAIGNDTFHFSNNYNLFSNINSGKNLYITCHNYPSYIDMIGNVVHKANVPVSSSSGNNFYGFNVLGAKGSYRYNFNTIQYCQGGYYWYGIKSDYPELCNGSQEINDNHLHHNTHAYYYRYGIWSYYASKSDSLHRIEIKRNKIVNNVTDYYYTYLIYTYYYGDYLIHDNLIAHNESKHMYLYAIYANYYGNYNILRNNIHHNRTSSQQGYFYGIYNYYNYNSIIASNLLHNNLGYYGTYGLYNYGSNSGNYQFKLQQNTIVIDGKNGNSSGHYAYPLYVMYPYYSNSVIKGNIFDIQNSAYAQFYFQAPQTPNISYNTYFIDSSSSVLYSITGAGSFTDIDTWIASGIGNNELNAFNVGGNQFDTSNYASTWFFNQDNCPSSSNNLLDVYGNSRNSTLSDRGAVEYSGATRIPSRTAQKVSRLYPNPSNAKDLILMNANNSKCFTLYNLQGQVVEKGNLIEGENHLSFEGLSKGIYFIQLEREAAAIKLIVQ